MKTHKYLPERMLSSTIIMPQHKNLFLDEYFIARNELVRLLSFSVQINKILHHFISIVLSDSIFAAS